LLRSIYNTSSKHPFLLLLLLHTRAY
jgi:hypothetical protein